MKHIYLKNILAALLLSVAATQAFAQAKIDTWFYKVKIDDLYYNLDYSDDTAEVCYNTSGYVNGNVVIPSNVTYHGNTYKVTRIGTCAFYGCTGLTSVTIPNSVTSIGYDVFSGCTALTPVHITDLASWCNISFNSNPLYYAEHLFLNGEEIKDLVIPNSVTSIGESAFSGYTGLTSVTIPNSVTSIGGDAFSRCTCLTSVTIPNSVTSIGDEAFSYCTGLTSVTIPEGVTRIGGKALYNCTGLASLTIGNSVTYIGYEAFYGCTNLTSVHITDLVSWCNISFYDNPLYYAKHLFLNEEEIKDLVIPNSVTRISALAFDGCTGLTSVTIGNGVTSIGGYAFDGCTGLTSATIPSSVTSIGDNVFNDCTNLGDYINVSVANYSDFCNNSALGLIQEKITKSVKLLDHEGNEIKVFLVPNNVTTIGSKAFCNCTGLASVTIGNNVTSIGYEAFKGCDAIIYAKNGTDGLISAWNYGIDPYETITTKLFRPYIYVIETTQSTAKYAVNNVYSNLKYNCEGESLANNEYLIKGLRPEYEKTIYLTVKSANNSYKYSTKASTRSISPRFSAKSVTASSISLTGGYYHGDANVVSQSVQISGKEFEGDNGTVCGLDPDKSYDCTYSVKVEYGEDNEYSYTYAKKESITTEKLTLTTQQQKVISEGNVIVAAESNLDDEETNVGFEWRRMDWTDDFASNIGGAYLYDGMMEGYIRNLNAEKLWKFRPYYESNAGNRYYGEWVGIDPSNTSYFEPTVHTYAKIQVEGNTALVKGYAMRGTDNVTVQGFKYWKTAAAVKADLETRGLSEAEIPADALTIEAKGQVMTASLKDLDYESTYNYVAFVTTSEGETFYGEQQMFKTGIDTTPVVAIEADNTDATIITRYDMQGRVIAKPQRGINILRMSDGSVRKVLVK